MNIDSMMAFESAAELPDDDRYPELHWQGEPGISHCRRCGGFLTRHAQTAGFDRTRDVYYENRTCGKCGHLNSEVVG